MELGAGTVFQLLCQWIARWRSVANACMSSARFSRGPKNLAVSPYSSDVGSHRGSNSLVGCTTTPSSLQTWSANRIHGRKFSSSLPLRVSAVLQLLLGRYRIAEFANGKVSQR